MDPTTVDTQSEYQELFNVYWPIWLGVMLLIWILIVVFAFRYRDRPGRDPMPTQKHENALVEAGYVVLLAGIAATLLFFTFTSMDELDANLPADSGQGLDEAQASDEDAPRPDARILVTASRWNWRFDYPEYGITQVGTGESIPTLVVPRGVVRFEQTSIDVIHSFFIPHLRWKRDVFPGRVIRHTLRFTDAGWHPGECAEYCGLRHAYMNFNTRVLPVEEFRAWARARRAGAPQQRWAAPPLGEPNTAFQEVEPPEGGERWVAPGTIEDLEDRP